MAGSMQQLLVCLVHTLAFACSTEALRVLIYAPTITHSHVMFNGRIADVLANAGHQVVLALAEIDPQVATNGSEYATVIRVTVNAERGEWKRTMFHSAFADHHPLHNSLISEKLWRGSKLLDTACSRQASNRALIARLRAYNFDVAMQEQYDACGFGLFHELNIDKFVWLSATAIFPPQPSAFGIEYPLSVLPTLFAPFNDEMNFVDRLNNFIISKSMEIMQNFASMKQTAIFAANSGNARFPDLSKLSASSRSVLINTSPLLDFPSPALNSIAYVGGVSLSRTVVALSSEWERIADAADDGVVLMTFGSVTDINEMPAEMRSVIFSVLERFSSYTFIVKYQNRYSTQKMPSNVVAKDWIPQVALMKHPKYRALITHAGWSSIIESIANGSPMILIPLYADHLRNAKVVEKKRLGIVLDKMKLTEQAFAHALWTVLHDKSFSKNAQRFSLMLRDSLSTPEELLLQQIELASKDSHPSRHTGGAQLPLFQYHFLDMLILLALFAVILC